MKYTVRIDDRVYEVEIGNLHSRPIIANVNGVPIEVWPESEIIASGVMPGSLPLSSASQGSAPDSLENSQPSIQESKTGAASAPGITTNSVTAPIPGVIVSIAVRPGDEVNPGQELCVLEAMKMMNTIRAARRGVISDLFVAVGQTVNHGDILMEFAD